MQKFAPALFAAVTTALELTPMPGAERTMRYEMLLDEKRNWHDSQAACQAWGGDLASIQNDAEQATVREAMVASGKNNAWIGYHQPTNTIMEKAQGEQKWGKHNFQSSTQSNSFGDMFELEFPDSACGGATGHVSFYWKDQGYGNAKGAFRVMVDGRDDSVMQLSPAPQTEQFVEMEISAEQFGDWANQKVKGQFRVGGGGGHAIYFRDFEMRVTYDHFVENTTPWEWSDGTAFTEWTNWSGGEPNDVGIEDCVHIWKRGDWEWNDARCTNKHYAMCGTAAPPPVVRPFANMNTPEDE